MGSRRKSRILAFQAIYSWEFHHPDSNELMLLSWLDQERKEQLDPITAAYARLIMKGTLENVSEIDDAIKENLEHWDFGRLSKVDLAILRISSYELMFQHDIPASVAIDEAIHLAKEFGGDESYRFINGILDSIRKKRKR